ncbi:MAG: NERD domain-containing protein [Acetanaerobacterium sp.]
MGLFDKIKEPVILKEDSSAKEQLKELEQMLETVTDPKMKTLLKKDIAAVNAGIFGEDIIQFELKNSHMPMFVLHDLFLEYEGLSAQIDFLIITRKRYFVIECKNLYGDITINDTGDFIRTIGKRKEGIYSPVTQGKRHLELIKQIRGAQRGNFLTKALFERNFYENYRTVVVLANSKTVLNDRFAPKEIKKQVIRADQLIEYIRKANKEPEAVASSESLTEELANFFLNKHCICKTDYLEKYQNLIQPVRETPIKVEDQQQVSSNSSDNADAPICPRCGAPMIKRKAVKGNKAGNEFWGCSKYPKCRGIINI